MGFPWGFLGAPTYRSYRPLLIIVCLFFGPTLYVRLYRKVSDTVDWKFLEIRFFPDCLQHTVSREQFSTRVYAFPSNHQGFNDSHVTSKKPKHVVVFMWGIIILFGPGKFPLVHNVVHEGSVKTSSLH